MHHDGSYSNEWEAAYDLSRLTIERPNETKLAQFFHDRGYFVVMCEYEMYCPHTDAILGSAKVIRHIFHTLAEAEAEVASSNSGDWDSNYHYVFAPRSEAKPVVATTDDIPF